MGQKKSVVNLIQSTRSEGIKINGKDVLKVYQGVFKQDYSVMRSDSAYFYVQDNAFDAFGNVNITQGDTLNIFSDKLNYNGNTKVAILTDNVKMVDKDATLTTNYLTYNTATRIGTYTGGGRLVNKDNVLTSKNGYYFARSRDAYFRFNVVLVTPDALIKTDTLHYSTASRIAYFLGPTNIYDTKDKKDTLYTENGLYNTVTEQAFFGKKNVYKSGSKKLRGDSLFYDKVKGYGRAVKHVIFTDSEQKITMTGNLGTYFKAEEKIVVTQDPLVIIVSESKDTSAKKDTVAVNLPLVKDKGVKVIKSVIKAGATDAAPPGTTPVKGLKMPLLQIPNKDTTKKVTVPAGAIPVKGLAMPQLKINGKDTTIKIKIPGGNTVTKALASPAPKNLIKDTVKRDSIYISGDTLESRILTYKDLKLLQLAARTVKIIDTTAKGKAKAAAVNTKAKPSKFLTATTPRLLVIDSSFLHRDIFGKPKPAEAKIVKATPLRKPDRNVADNEPEISAHKIPELSDTARIRIVIAHHHAKLFKSDLQAKADSMFYSYSDSTLRNYVNPIIWAQGSQLSGDTIYMQMRNKKLDNLDMFPSAFIVNIEKADSIHFNQIGGKRMKGYFKNDKLDRMYVTGNAESIYFVRDSVKVTEMQRSLSSRMRIRFKDNSASNITFLVQPDHRYGSLGKFTEDERILKGFIWKPKERPFSKESILPSYSRKHNPPPAKAVIIKKPGNSKGLPGSTNKFPTDSLQNKLPALIPLKTSRDSVVMKRTILNTPKKDSLSVRPNVPAPNTKKDSVAGKALPQVN